MVVLAGYFILSFVGCNLKGLWQLGVAVMGGDNCGCGCMVVSMAMAVVVMGGYGYCLLC